MLKYLDKSGSVGKFWTMPTLITVAGPLFTTEWLSKLYVCLVKVALNCCNIDLLWCV